MQIWAKKYAPQNSGAIIHNLMAMEQLKKFIQNPKKKCALVYGPTGCGKTTAVYALANETNYEVLEVNASDFRNKEAMRSIVGNASKQMSLFTKGKILLIDEVDNLSGVKDRGGAQELARIAEETKWPIIMTANDHEKEQLKDLKKKSELISFEKVDHPDVLKILKAICEAEKIKFDETELKKLALCCGGDIRGAVNDLQGMCEGKKQLEKGDTSIIGERDYERSLVESLRVIMKSRNANDTLRIFDNVDTDFDEVIMWEDENLPKEYSGEDLANAYDTLSRADVFRGRIRRWQHWRFLVYINDLLSAGIALAKKEKNPHFINYSRSSRILKLWLAKMRYGKKAAVAEKIAKKTHASKRKVLQEYVPYIKKVFENGQGEGLAKELELSEEEIDWLTN